MKFTSGTIYYTIVLINGKFQVVFFEWCSCEADYNRKKAHLCFEKKEEADRAMGKILKALKRKG